MFVMPRLLSFLLAITLSGLMLLGIAVATVWISLGDELPSVETLRDVRLQVPLRVYSSEGDLIAEYGEQRREPVTREEIPESMVQAILAVEDANFYSHTGVDIFGLTRALISLIQTGEKQQGGSTITMQLARNFFLSPEKSYKRKAQEILLAMRIEQELTKDEILTLYLNKVFLGHRSYGIKAAAYTYYQRNLDELTIAELAMIAGLPKAPSTSNPLSNPERAIQRRNHVLERMFIEGFIDKATRDEQQAAPITATRYQPNVILEADYVGEMVRADMLNRYGDAAYIDGYRVYTTVRSPAQRAANQAVRDALDAYDMRHGYRGAELQLDNWQDRNARRQQLESMLTIGSLIPAVVIDLPDEKTALVEILNGDQLLVPWDGLKWAAPYVSANSTGRAPSKASEVVSPGDVIRIQQRTRDTGESYWRLAQIPSAQAALISLNPTDGGIVALAGGYDFYHSKFNRVTQAKRQSGSGFKGIVYAAALAAGYQPASIINDAPIVVSDPTLPDGYWRPSNFNREFSGPTPLRVGLAASKNLVSIRLLRSIDLNFSLDYMTNFGFTREMLPPGLALALGSGEVTPLEMARAYSVFANGGFLITPYLVERIEQDGTAGAPATVVFTADPLIACDDCMGVQLAPRTITPQNSFLMYNMLREVVKAGTARRALELNRTDLAGKTGTTNEYKDAWFNGFNQSLVAVSWVGNDDSTTLGSMEQGGRAALPIWIDYMRVALEGVPDTLPEVPEGVQLSANGVDYEDLTVVPIFDASLLREVDSEPAVEDDLF